MARSSRLVTVEINGDVRTHMPANDGNTYATLCGLDGGDDAIGMRTVETPRGAKIDCQYCFAIWQESRRWKAGDFSENPS